jgi:uncharacterized membrane protein
MAAEATNLDARPARAAARLWEIDALRGLAVVLMIFYHLVWDLSYFGIYQANIAGLGWQAFARGIGSTFVFLLGLSMVLREARRPAAAGAWSFAAFRPYLRRGLLIFACGLIITLVAHVAVGPGAILFGILHLLGLALILAYPFLRWPAPASLAAGILCLAVGFYLFTLQVDTWALVWLGLQPRGVVMVDHYGLLPWFGMALLGVWAGKVWYPAGARAFALPAAGDGAAVRGLRFLGRHSLAIYLLHQPILIGMFYALGYGRG